MIALIQRVSSASAIAQNQRRGACDDRVREGSAYCARHSLPPEGASDAEWAEWMMDAEVA